MPLESLQTDNLHLEVTGSEGEIRVTWRGKANARRPSALLSPWFDDVVEEAKLGKKTIFFSMSQLDHISSSTIVVVVQLIKRLEAERIGITIEYDESVNWQHMTFDALRYLSGPEKVLQLKNAAS